MYRDLHDAIRAIGILMNDGKRFIVRIDNRQHYGIHIQAVWEFIDWLEQADRTATIAETGSTWFDGVSGLRLDAESYYQTNLLLAQ